MMKRLAACRPIRYFLRPGAAGSPVGGSDEREAGRQVNRVVLCREGRRYLLLAAAVFGAAMMREVNLMLLLGGMMFGPLLFNWRLTAATLRGLKLRRTIPRGICAGDLLVVELELSNTRRRLGSWALNVRERIVREGNSSEPIAATEYFAHVPPGGRLVRTYRGRFPQRGRYRWEAADVSTRFPFGFIRRTILLGDAGRLIVFPRLGRLTQGWIKRRRAVFEGSHRRERRESRASGDLYGAREWQRGDSRRWIHWKSTAKHGSLVVRQFEQHRSRDVAVLLDLWQPDQPSMEDRENVELAVSFAATVIADVSRKTGCKVLLGIGTTEPEFFGGTVSVAVLEDAMTRLATVEASAADRLPGLLAQTVERIDRGTEVIVVSTREIDFEDQTRFADLWREPSWRARLRQIRTVTTAKDDLDQYFRPE